MPRIPLGQNSVAAICAKRPGVQVPDKFGLPDIEPLVRFPLPAQPVDATPSNQLIRRYFPIENPSVRLNSIRPGQSGVPFELAVESPARRLRASVASTH
jgi:hypothetical protein